MHTTYSLITITALGFSFAGGGLTAAETPHSTLLRAFIKAPIKYLDRETTGQFSQKPSDDYTFKTDQVQQILHAYSFSLTCHCVSMLLSHVSGLNIITGTLPIIEALQKKLISCRTELKSIIFRHGYCGQSALHCKIFTCQHGFPAWHCDYSGIQSAATSSAVIPLNAEWVYLGYNKMQASFIWCFYICFIYPSYYLS